MGSYDEAKQKSKELFEQISNLSTELELLNEKVKEEALKNLAQEKLLSRLSWELNYDSLTWRGTLTPKKPTVTLVASRIQTDIEAQEAQDRLCEMFEIGYHCQTMITHESQLRFDDGEMSLRFTSLEEMKNFCVEHDIKINVAKVRSLIKREQEMIKTSEDKIKHLQAVMTNLFIQDS